MSKDLKKFKEILKDFQRCQKILRNSKRFLEIFKDSKKLQLTKVKKVDIISIFSSTVIEGIWTLLFFLTISKKKKET